MLRFIINFFKRQIAIYSRNHSHRKKQATGERVIDKLRSFKGDFREARMMSYLRQIDPYAFEELLLSAFERRGMQVKRNRKYSHDGGIDGVIYRNGVPVYVQAKRYGGHIKREQVVDFINLVNRNKMGGGMFIHTGRTGSEIYSMVKGTNVEIISGNKLISLIDAAA